MKAGSTEKTSENLTSSNIVSKCTAVTEEKTSLPSKQSSLKGSGPKPNTFQRESISQMTVVPANFSLDLLPESSFAAESILSKRLRYTYTCTVHFL